MANKKIMIAGYGSTGQYVLDLITRMPELKDACIYVLSRTSKEEMMARLNVTVVSAGLMEYYPSIKYISADLNDVEKMAQILEEVKPDIIAYTGRFIKGVKYGAYSYPNQLGYGVWLPLAIPLIHKLMLAVKMAGIETKVINSSFPDGVCPALASIGLAPFTGVGNLNHLIPRIKRSICIAEEVETPYQVDVKMIGSHYLNTYVSKEGSAKGSPYHLSYTIDGKVPAGKIKDEVLFNKAVLPMATDQTRNLMISSDIAQVIRALCSTEKESTFMHLPGALGYIGGYPCHITEGELTFDLPTGVTLAEAERINKESLRYDGIEEIVDGEIVFTDLAISRMKEVFGIQYPKRLKVEACEEFAYQIKEKLEEYQRGK